MLGLLGLAEFIPAALLAIPTGQSPTAMTAAGSPRPGWSDWPAVNLALAVDAGAGDRPVWPLYALAFMLRARQCVHQTRRGSSDGGGRPHGPLALSGGRGRTSV